MPYKMNQKQFEAVLSLDSFKRYDHFIGKVVDWEQLWALQNDQGYLTVVAPGSEEFEYFPLWPHPEYAQKVGDNIYPGHAATEISLKRLLDHWLPLLQEDGVRVGVFPNMEAAFWCITPEDLMEELSSEMQKYL